MTVGIAPDARMQFFDDQGNVLAGGLLFTYLAGTTTKRATFTDSTGGVSNQNPIELDAAGRTPDGVWLSQGVAYKFVLAPANDTDPPASPMWSEDEIQGVFNLTVTVSQWQAGPAATYLTASSFSLVGDKRTDFHVGRRLQFVVSAGTVYGRITGSSFAANLTTVTMQMDGSQALDIGLTTGAVNYSLLTADVLAVPTYSATATYAADVYTASVGAGRLVIGDEYRIRVANTNISTNVAFNIDALGPVTAVKNGGVALAIGDLQAGGEYTVRYITGNRMHVLNPTTPSGALRGYIDGFLMSAPGGGTVFTINPGEASDSTNTMYLNLAAQVLKTTSAWSAGSGPGVGGKLYAAAVSPSTWQHWYLIYNPTTRVLDLGFDTNASVPTLPADYTIYRLIGSGFLDASSQWRAVISYGDFFEWVVPLAEVNASNPGTSAILRTVSTPLGRKTEAVCAAMESNQSNNRTIYYSDPAVTDTAPSTPPFTMWANTSANSMRASGQIRIRTNTSSQIRYRSDASGASDATVLSVLGYIDSRGKDA